MANSDEYYMQEALKEAKKAYRIDEVPIGCVIVKEGIIISRGYNKKEKSNDVTAHAEILAIRKASKKLGWRLADCDIFITVEPCPMCMSAIIQSRIRRVIYGASEPKWGACGSKIDLADVDFNHKAEIKKGVLEVPSKELVQQFFKRQRINKSKKE